jgi:hypothetical protein
MDPATDRFIELATRPLAGNAELHLAAAGELRRGLAENSASPGAIAQAADSLARADRHPRRHWWRMALYLTTLVVSLAALVYPLRMIHDFTLIKSLFLPTYDWLGEIKEPASSTLTTQQKLLLYGKDGAINPEERWKPLWDSEPDNPAFLAQYAAAYFNENKTLSAEILDAAARIDPDNGWFPALAAVELVESAVTENPRTSKEKKDFKTPEWEIKDAEKLNKTLALIHQAAEKPRFTSYEETLIKQRIPLLPKRHDYVSQIPPIAYMASQTTAVLNLLRLSQAMAAGAQECAARNDVDGFRQIIGDWEHLAKQSTGNGFTLVDLLVARVFLFRPVANFRDAAQTLGLDEETLRFTKLNESQKSEKEARERRGKLNSETENLVEKHGSLFASLSLPMVAKQVKSPPPLTAADLRPARYADNALFSRAASILAWAVLGLCSGFAALHRYRQSPLIRTLSGRMLDLLRTSDWITIFAGGILLPVLWYVAVTRLTPLSAREWSFRSSGFIQHNCQSGSLLVMLILLPVVIATWRLAKRGALLGMRTRFPWAGWLAALSAALATAASGAMMLGNQNLLIYPAFALLGIPVLWMIIGFSRNVLGTHPHALRRATLARIVLPTWIFGMLVMIATVPPLYLEECHWIQQDRLFEFTAAAPALSRYEWEVTQQLRKELLEMME